MSALIWSPFGNAEQARAVIGTVLEEGLVACGNMIPQVESIFLWEGKIHRDHEIGVLFKTDVTLLEQAVARIEMLHPYDTPAVFGWPCDAAPATANWLAGFARNSPD